MQQKHDKNSREIKHRNQETKPQQKKTETRESCSVSAGSGFCVARALKSFAENYESLCRPCFLIQMLLSRIERRVARSLKAFSGSNRSFYFLSKSFDTHRAPRRARVKIFLRKRRFGILRRARALKPFIASTVAGFCNARASKSFIVSTGSGFCDARALKSCIVSIGSGLCDARALKSFIVSTGSGFCDARAR